MKKASYLVILLLFFGGFYFAGSRHTRQAAPGDSPGLMGSGGGEGDLPPGTVKVSPEKQQLIGVQVKRVEKKAARHTLRLPGTVAADETRFYTINATVDGWISKTFPQTTGSFVKKNEVLATFYSPEFIAAAQGLFVALSAADRAKPTAKGTPLQMDQLAGFKLNLQQYLDSLKNLGMSEIQIERMTKTREWYQNVDMVSPADGLILARNVSDGLRFTKGTELYRIADLRRIWILADAYGKEVQYFKPGVEAKVTLPDQEKVYRARVSKVPPVFDTATRTLKVRLEADNPGLSLRPGMFVDVEFSIQLPPGVIVPSDAIVDSGLKKTVFVEQGSGVFEPREVETGWRFGSQVEITKGLSPGERIVTSGTFLIDSESRMEQAAAGMTGSLAKDPVTGADISMRKAEKAGLMSTYQQKVYYFASVENRARFEQEPGRYVKKP